MTTKNFSAAAKAIVLISAIVLVGVTLATPAPALASGCNKSDVSFSWTSNGSASIRNNGDAGCDVYMASYEINCPSGTCANNAGWPWISSQTMFDQSSQFLNPGQTKSISVGTPDCEFQTDLVVTEPISPPNYSAGYFLGVRFGGPSGVWCNAPTTPTISADIKANQQDGTITIPSGTAATLTWTSDNANACTVTPGNFSGISGTQTTGPLSASRTYTVNCRKNGLTASDQVTVNVTQASGNPVADIKANQQDGTITIPAGTRPEITWTSDDVSSCTISPTGWTGLSGDVLDLPLSASRTYTVSCTGPYGPAQDQVTVNVAQQQAIDADIKANGQDVSTTISYNTAANLTWTSSGATSCVVTPGGWTTLNSTGQTTGNLVATQTYTLTCTGPAGSDQDQVTVIVSQAPVIDADIKANGQDGSTTISYGSSANLTWTSNGATSCSVNPGGWTTLTSNGQTTGALYGTQTYTINCTGPGGSDTDSVVVNVEGQQQNPPSVTLNANPSFIYQGQSSTLNWTSQNTASCYASAGPWNGQKSNGYGNESASPYQTSSYTITCTGTNGQTVSANTTITVGTNNCTGQYCGGGQGYVQVTKSVMNQTFGQSSFFSSYAEAQSGDTLVFEIRVRNTGSSYTYVNVRDQLPPELIYIPGSTMMGGFPIQDGIVTGGVNVGSLNVNEERVITFRTTVAQGIGTRLIVNQAFANGNFGSSNVGTAQVQVRPRGQVLGAADIVTGPENPIIWTLVLGLVFTLVLHLVLSKKLGFSAFPSIGAFLTSTRLERRLRDLRRRELKPDAE